MKRRSNSWRLDPDRKSLLEHGGRRRVRAEASLWFGTARGGDLELAEQAGERSRRNLVERHAVDGPA